MLGLPDIAEAPRHRLALPARLPRDPYPAANAEPRWFRLRRGTRGAHARGQCHEKGGFGENTAQFRILDRPKK